MRGYSLTAPAEMREPVVNWKGHLKGYIHFSHQHGHGDLLIHEIHLSGAGDVVHEIHFHHGSTIIIECADIICRQELF